MRPVVASLFGIVTIAVDEKRVSGIVFSKILGP